MLGHPCRRPPSPLREGWSLTVDDLSGQPVTHSPDRYAITSISALPRTCDGSVVSCLQPHAIGAGC